MSSLEVSVYKENTNIPLRESRRIFTGYLRSIEIQILHILIISLAETEKYKYNLDPKHPQHRYLIRQNTTNQDIVSYTV